MKMKSWLIGAFLAGATLAANASDYGCKVLLCLANPNGPTAVAECVPPITQLWDDLAHFRGFPTCDMASGPQGGSYASQGLDYYNVCPVGMSELGDGVFALKGKELPTFNFMAKASAYVGIGKGDATTLDRNNLPRKIRR